MDERTIKRSLPWVVAAALFMEQLDATIVNTAVPAMAASLHVTPLSLKAVAASYILSLAVGIPISGWVADRYGSRRVFAIAVAVFTLASVGCGLAQNAGQMVAARILQGAGAALMTPVGRMTIVRTFDKSELLQAMNFVIIPALIGPLLGPTVGGLIVNWLSWRVIFFVNVPVGLLAQWLVHRYMPDYRKDTRRPLDWAGLMLFGSGTALLSWLLEIFGEHQIEPVPAAGIFTVSVALLVAYWLHARVVPFPLLRLSLFGTRTFRVSVIGGFVTRLGVGGLPFLTPLLFQVGLGMPAWQSGLLMMPTAAAAMGMKICANPVPIRLQDRPCRQYGDDRRDDRALCACNSRDVPALHHRDRAGAGFFQLAAVHQHEQYGLRRHRGAGFQHGRDHRKLVPADFDELWARGRLACRRLVSGWRAADRSARRRRRPASGLSDAWRFDYSVFRLLLDPARRRRRQC